MTPLKKTLECKIQSKIIKKLEAEGYYVLKLIKTNKNGIPDLIAIKENETFFIEVKRPNGRLSEVQKFRIKELQSNNIKVKVWQDYEQEFKESKMDLKFQQEQSNF
jgi:Holliday junction resolvase-like predicted endonuclease